MAGRLYLLGFHRQYRAFFLYLVFATLRGGILAAFDLSSPGYYRSWVLTEPLEWILYAIVILELYSLVLRDYRGLATVGRWIMIAGIAVALVASCLSLLAPSRYTSQGLVLTYYYVAERAVYFSLAVFLVTTVGLLLKYPIIINRNMVVHSIVFSIYFFASAFSYLLLSMLGYQVIVAVRFILVAISVGAVGSWLVFLNSAGEQRNQTLRPSWMPGREEELVGQLTKLNLAMQALID